MNREDIKRRMEQYIKEGQKTTQEASAYLKAHSHEWNMDHERHWQKRVIRARMLLGKVYALKELLDKKEELH